MRSRVFLSTVTYASMARRDCRASCSRHAERFCHSYLFHKFVQLLLPLIETALCYFQLSIEVFFKKSTYVGQCGLVKHEFFLLGDGAIALRESLAPVSWYVRVNLDVEGHFCTTNALKHPRQREGLRVLERLYNESIISSAASGETQETSKDVSKGKDYPK